MINKGRTEELDQSGFNGFTTAIEYHYSVRPELGE